MPWRIASVVLLSAVAIALAEWIYDAGRQFAGFHQSESGEQLAEYRAKVESLTSELSVAQGIADSSAARLQVESTAQERLAMAVKSLEEENARLKSELAVFENLAGNERVTPGLAISRFDVSKELNSGNYRFNLLVTKSGSNADRNFKGKLELTLTVDRDGQSGSISVPDGNGTALSQVQFRLFKRIDGQFSVPAGAKLVSVEAKLIEDGHVRAAQTVRMSAAGGK